MKMQIALASSEVYYHGTKKKFSKFSEYRPAFFTKNLAYAQEYGPLILAAKLNMHKVFDTYRDKRAVQIYNEYFLSSGLARPEAKLIKLGHHVSMNDADELWAYLAVPEYPAPHYDGLIVSEQGVSSLHEKFKGADLAYVPMSVDQIQLVKI